MPKTLQLPELTSLTSLLEFLRDHLNWPLPKDGLTDELTFDWSGDELRLPQSASQKLGGGIIRQLRSFVSGQPWGIFLVEFADVQAYRTALRQVLRGLVPNRRRDPNLQSWQHDNLLFICATADYARITFAHFRGDKAHRAKLTTFGWRRGTSYLRTLLEHNLPKLAWPKEEGTIQQEGALEDIRAFFDDKQKPTFVWQLDFAEVFHRFVVPPSGGSFGVPALAGLELGKSNATGDSNAGPAKAGTPNLSGFDLIIGNPPYVRIQVLNQEDPGFAAWLKENYHSASKGNYDLYAVFVERSLQLLQARGQLAFILPHKFFNAQYGQPLRELLASGRHLRHVVHFGDQQIFPAATNYVCLMFLSRAGADACRWTRADNLPEWLQTFRASETEVPAARLTDTEWNFAVGKNAGLFEKLQQMPVKLSDVAEMFVGVQTDADDVFIVEVVSQKGGKLIAYSKYTEREHEFEATHLKPFLKGSLNVRRYALTDLTKRLVFPYENREGISHFISAKEYGQKFPLTWNYLKACRSRLIERADGKFTDYWHGYVYKKNHTRFEQPKLVVPAIGLNTCFAADLEGSFYFVGSGGGGGGGYGIVPKPEAQMGLQYLLAVLNSSISAYLLKRISTPFRGGYFALTRQFIAQLPIRPIDFSVASERAEHDALAGLVERILSAKRAAPLADTSALEREIDQRVYHLYALTPDEIKLVEESAK